MVQGITHDPTVDKLAIDAPNETAATEVPGHDERQRWR
jgi:hypothetical protein